MFGERCSLCGGKLDRDRVCTECGLDNRKSDKQYKINQSRCDNEPMTHVHTDKNEKEKPKREKTPKENYQQGSHRPVPKVKKKRKAGKVISIIITVMVTFFGILPALMDLVENSDLGMQVSNWLEDKEDADSSDSTEYPGEEYDPYAYVTRELSAEGEVYETQLTQGDYLVGVHIPEGTYHLSKSGETGNLHIADEENGIWLSEFLDETNLEKDDIRLYDGAVVTWEGDAQMILKAENAQTAALKPMVANPLTESVEVPVEQTLKAGKDFPEGVYDIVMEKGYGSLNITINNRDGEQIDYRMPWLSDGTEGERVYRNVVLPNGAVVENPYGGDAGFVLQPSEQVFSLDYGTYYPRYESEY